MRVTSGVVVARSEPPAEAAGEDRGTVPPLDWLPRREATSARCCSGPWRPRIPNGSEEADMVEQRHRRQWQLRDLRRRGVNGPDPPAVSRITSLPSVPSVIRVRRPLLRRWGHRSGATHWQRV